MTRQALASLAPMPVFLMAGDLVVAGLTSGNITGNQTGANAGKMAPQGNNEWRAGQGVRYPVTVSLKQAASDAALFHCQSFIL